MIKNGFMISSGKIWEIEYTRQTRDFYFLGDKRFTKRSKIFKTLEDAESVLISQRMALTGRGTKWSAN